MRLVSSDLVEASKAFVFAADRICLEASVNFNLADEQVRKNKRRHVA